MSRRRLVDPTETPTPAAPEEAPSHARLRAKTMTLGQFAEQPTRKKKLYGADKYRAEMETYAESGEWDGATGGHLVALYDKFHRAIYGVASDLDRKTWMFATSAADRMVLRDFAGEVADAVRFLRWTWKEEARTEEWRRANHKSGRVIGWRLQFCFRDMLTKYLVYRQRFPNE